MQGSTSIGHIRWQNEQMEAERREELLSKENMLRRSAWDSVLIDKEQIVIPSDKSTSSGSKSQGKTPESQQKKSIVFFKQEKHAHHAPDNEDQPMSVEETCNKKCYDDFQKFEDDALDEMYNVDIVGLDQIMEEWEA